MRPARRAPTTTNRAADRDHEDTGSYDRPARVLGELPFLPRSAVCADFLTVDPAELCMRFGQGPYDRVFMNPPFAEHADIRRVTHALDFLKPDGLLVAVMSAGAEFRTAEIAEQFPEASR
jgi:hypothetical protein